MSIIREAIEYRDSMRPGYSRGEIRGENVQTTNPKILDLSVLKDYVGKVLDHMSVESRPELEGYRKFTYLWEVPIGNVLGRVDEPTWVFMIEKQANWVIESREAVQPNGRWHVCAHEFDIVTRNKTRKRTVGKNADGVPEVLEIEEPTDFLRVGIQLVDVNGDRDLVYEMGRPSTRKDSFDPSMLKELMKNAPVSSNTGEYEEKLTAQGEKLTAQAEIISNLQQESAKTNELMAALLSELQELKGSRKVVSRGRKKTNG
jgi:hypothetical protein